MIGDFLERFALGTDHDTGATLQVRIFRLICAATAVLSLGCVLPVNLLQDLPPEVHLINGTIGLLGAFCFWASRRGRHPIRSFLVVVILLLDLGWFVNGGSEGSLVYYFFPALLLIFATQRGPWLWPWSTGLAVNVVALFLVEDRFPHLVARFQSPADRMLDLETGVVFALIACGMIVWVLLASYEREQVRLAETAARLEASEENYREIFNSTSDALFIHRADGTVLDLNAQAEAMFAADRATLLRFTYADFSLGDGPASRAAAAERVRLAVAGQPQLFEWHARRRDGRPIWTEVALRACTIAGETRVIGSLRDTSERRRSDAMLRRNGERLQLAMTASAQGWFELNVQTGEAVASEEYVRLIGHDPATFVSSLPGWLAAIHPDDRDRVTAYYHHIVASSETGTVEYRWRTKSGAWKWIRSVGKIVENDATGRPLQMSGTHADISDWKQAEAALRKNEERLRLAMVGAAQGWFEINVQTGAGASSPEYVRMIGHDPETFVTTHQTWLAGIHPDDRELARRTVAECISHGDTRTMEYRRQTKSGAWIWIRSVGKIVEYDDAGKPLRMYGMHADITARKELELQLLHSQRLETVGTLAGGVAHDLNNILTPMLMASSILRETLTAPADRELIAMIDGNGKRGAAIVKQLVAFSRSMAQDRQALDPRQILQEIAQLMSASLPKSIAVLAPDCGNAGLVQVDPTQLQQVLMNLCVNARDAMPSGGTITLRVRREELPADGQARNGGATGGTFVVITVADTGTGIPPEIIDRIFDPFFSTKGLGKGTGLGLASSHGIIKAHGGFMRVESTPGQGSIFRLYLPALNIGVHPTAADPTAPTASANECILIVDDDPAVLLSTRRRLEPAGYRVLSADNGRDALRLLERSLAEVRVVVTDFAMPGLDGPTLAPLLRNLAPAVPIIGVSGNDHRTETAALQRLGFSEILRKPFETGDLLQAIQRQLAGATNRPPPA